MKHQLLEQIDREFSIQWFYCLSLAEFEISQCQYTGNLTEKLKKCVKIPANPIFSMNTLSSWWREALVEFVLPGDHFFIRPVVVLFYHLISLMVQQSCSIIQRKFPFTDKPNEKRKRNHHFKLT